MEWFMQPWPWWISGILIGLTVPLLYLLAGKAFGISTSLQQIGAMCAPNSKFEYLRKHDRTRQPLDVDLRDWNRDWCIRSESVSECGTGFLATRHV